MTSAMKIGFDYWQVISHYPEQVGAICEALQAAGHEVHVISAIGKGRVGTIAAEVHNVWPTFPGQSIHEVVFDGPHQSPALKLAKCRELGITVFFDDRDDVCRLLNKNGILGMRVTRRDGSTYDLDSERR
jgi:acid phosphatase class B